MEEIETPLPTAVGELREHMCWSVETNKLPLQRTTRTHQSILRESYNFLNVVILHSMRVVKLRKNDKPPWSLLSSMELLLAHYDAKHENTVEESV